MKNLIQERLKHEIRMRTAIKKERRQIEKSLAEALIKKEYGVLVVRDENGWPQWVGIHHTVPYGEVRLVLPDEDE